MAVAKISRTSATSGKRRRAANGAWDPESGHLRVVIDTPRGSAVKYKLEPRSGAYTISHVLPAGAVFPFDFGSVPATRAEDGDPLDVLVLLEHATFPGCLVRSRLIGAIEAEQTEGKRTERNDRLVAVAEASRVYCDATSLDDLQPRLLEEIEHFFTSYNQERGREFRVIGRSGPAGARRLVDRGERQARRRS
jgi:inorganic pyrophosphatase